MRPGAGHASRASKPESGDDSGAVGTAPQARDRRRALEIQHRLAALKIAQNKVPALARGQYRLPAVAFRQDEVAAQHQAQSC